MDGIGAAQAGLEALQRHGVESVEREVRWLSDLIRAERGESPEHVSTSSDQ